MSRAVVVSFIAGILILVVSVGIVVVSFFTARTEPPADPPNQGEFDTLLVECDPLAWYTDNYNHLCDI